MSYKTDPTPEAQARCENIEELFNGIKEYTEEESESRRELLTEGEEIGIVTLSDFLENIFLLSESEKDDLTDSDGSDNRITLMTVHASKGLEYPYVYIAGMEEGLFPPSSDMFNITRNEVEEERRLFYVAITRAEKAVTLSYARNRKRWGKDESNPVSRFLKEIDSQYMECPVSDEAESCHSWFSPRKSKEPENGTAIYRPRNSSEPVRQRTAMPDKTRIIVPEKPKFTQTRRTPDPNFKADPVSELRAGQRVEHDRFGFGTIISLEGMGADLKAVVEFDETGKKTLLLKYAKLRIDR